MRPPICCICYERFSPQQGSGLLHFVLTEAEKEANKRFEQPGFVGHPEGSDWFCATHYSEAKKLTGENLGFVIRKLRGQI